MPTWRRAEPFSFATWFALMFVIFGVGFTAVTTFLVVTDADEIAGALRDSGIQRDIPWIIIGLGILGIWGFMTLWTGFAWRMYRTGIYVSAQAVRLVYPWRSRIVAWSDVAEVSSRRAMVLGRTTVRDAIVLKLTDGTELETPVQQRARVLALGHRKNIGPVLTAAEFAATLAFLREMHREAVASRPPG